MNSIIIFLEKIDIFQKETGIGVHLSFKKENKVLCLSVGYINKEGRFSVKHAFVPLNDLGSFEPCFEEALTLLMEEVKDRKDLENEQHNN